MNTKDLVSMCPDKACSDALEHAQWGAGMTAAHKTNWLDRHIAHPGPHLCLCVTSSEYEEACWRLKVKPSDLWCQERGARTHVYTHPHKDSTCIVCIDAPRGDMTNIQIAALLVHEAVHVWQEYRRQIGEHTPGTEQEAYGIQAISQELFDEYARRFA